MLYALIAQLGLQIVFTAVWVQPPSVFERFVARRERLERLSLPLGSNFLITAPPEHSLVPFLQRQKHNKSENIKARGREKKGREW